MLIERITEPKKLYLVWQAPDHLKDRHRWAVAQITPRSDVAASLRYIVDETEFRAVNSGRSMVELERLGYAGFPAFRRNQTLYDQGVIEALARRIPSRERPDFAAYLESLGFSRDVKPSNLALLAYTEAKLPSDGFSVVDPLDKDQEDVDVVIELAGSRYYLSKPLAEVPDRRVTLRPEPQNAYDAKAIQVFSGSDLIGYVNRLQAETIGHWLSNNELAATIHRLNGTPDRPRIYVLLRVRPERPNGQLAA